jgi:hypothetical protein
VPSSESLEDGEEIARGVVEALDKGEALLALNGEALALEKGVALALNGVALSLKGETLPALDE